MVGEIVECREVRSVCCLSFDRCGCTCAGEIYYLALPDRSEGNIEPLDASGKDCLNVVKVRVGMFE